MKRIKKDRQEKNNLKQTNGDRDMKNAMQSRRKGYKRKDKEMKKEITRKESYESKL